MDRRGKQDEGWFRAGFEGGEQLSETGELSIAPSDEQRVNGLVFWA